MRKVCLAGTSAALTLVLAACTGSGAGPTDGRATEPTPAPASARLADAVDDVLTTGRYEQAVTTPGLDSPYYEVSGAYDVPARRFTAVMAFWNPEAGETRRIEHRYLDGRGFQHAQAWGGRKDTCWLLIDPPGSGLGRQPGGLAAADAPAAVRALATIEGASTAEPGADEIEARIDLRIAASLLPGYLRIRMRPTTGTVRAVFTLDARGALVGWEVAGVDLISALQQAGADLADDLVAGISTFTLDVSYDAVGAPVRVAAPSRGLWMSQAAMDAHRGCPSA